MVMRGGCVVEMPQFDDIDGVLRTLFTSTNEEKAMAQKLFEFAAIYTPAPTKDELERGIKPKSVLVVPITPIVANNDKEAMMMASREIPQEYVDKLDQVEIAVRPF